MTGSSRGSSRNHIKRLTITGMLSAIIIIMVYTPLGMITIGPISTTFAHVPILIGLLVEGPVVGLVLALVFGAASMVRAYISPTGLLSVFFQDPLISIIPRLFIPLTAWLFYKLLKKVLPDTKAMTKVAWAGAGLIGSLTNTVLVLAGLYLLHARGLIEKINQSALTQYTNQPGQLLFYAVALPNGIPEAIVTMVLVPAVLAAITAMKKRR